MAWPAVAAAAISAVASLIGGGMSAGSSALANKKAFKNSMVAQLQNQQWQEHMSNTAHQREVKDLREAGLNPILSATGGASTPSGGVVSAPQSDPGNQGIQTALQIASALKQFKQQDRNLDIQDRHIDNESRSVRIAEHLEPYQQSQIEAAINASNADVILKTATAKQIEEATKWIGPQALAGISAVTSNNKVNSAKVNQIGSEIDFAHYDEKQRESYYKKHPFIRGIHDFATYSGIGNLLGPSDNGSRKSGGKKK